MEPLTRARTESAEPGGTSPRRVRLGATVDAPGPLTELVLREPVRDVAGGLELAEALAAASASPTRRDLWEALATLAADDLGAVRAAEPHLDAIGILREAGHTIPAGRYGVYAAEGGEHPLRARRDADGWRLTGVKLWCSLAATLDRALVAAADESGATRLFDVSLRGPGVAVERSAWAARGLVEIPSGPVRFDEVAAMPVGDAGWYLSRPGFDWGGIGVAACWYGGAVAIGRTVHRGVAARPTPLRAAHLGAIDVALQDARRALDEAATAIDERAGLAPRPLAMRVRATVARTCEEVLLRAGHALGPAPLALDAAHAKRVADLQLYIRQHHAEADEASLGDALVAGAAGDPPW